MRITLLSILVFSVLIMASAGDLAAAQRDREGSDSAGEALSGAVMGGLLGAGLGAAIGSASGHAGKGAAIGAGVGAVGGTLLKANEASNRRSQAEAEEEYDEYPVVEERSPEASNVVTTQARSGQTAESVAVKKRIIRRYDDKGNVVSEEEVGQ